jgi:NAD(P)-dependent dehydrogenase (short-subunit alcohol dehydrogenase family)
MSVAASPGLFDLSGKVALVTGATRGIGLAIAEEMARAGAEVVISSDESEACGTVASILRDAGLKASGMPCDVASRGALESLVAAVLARYGCIDVLVCNAGIQPPHGPLHERSDSDWDATMTVNLRSVLWLTSLVIPEMAARREGSVILMASISAVRGNKAIGLYALSKAACAQLARNLAVEWGPSNVRVNSIAPGLIATDFSRSLMDNPEALKRRLALTPLRRAGEPAEVAGVAVMLAARAGAFVTGQNLIVDGGTVISDGN